MGPVSPVQDGDAGQRGKTDRNEAHESNATCFLLLQSWIGVSSSLISQSSLTHRIEVLRQESTDGDLGVAHDQKCGRRIAKVCSRA